MTANANANSSGDAVAAVWCATDRSAHGMLIAAPSLPGCRQGVGNGAQARHLRAGGYCAKGLSDVFV